MIDPFSEGGNSTGEVTLICIPGVIEFLSSKHYWRYNLFQPPIWDPLNYIYIYI